MREIPVGTILWKLCWSQDGERVIVKLEVTKPGICADYDTVVDYYSYARNNRHNKCRVREAKVLEMKLQYDDTDVSIAHSDYSFGFTYEVGETVAPDNGFDEGNYACGSGIHGFEDREKAEQYML